MEPIDEDEARAAAEQKQRVCPECGDWLPVELGDVQCMGKGHHVAVARDSLFPEHKASASGNPREQALRKAHRWLDLIAAVAIVVFTSAVLWILLREHQQRSIPPQDVPAAKVPP